MNCRGLFVLRQEILRNVVAGIQLIHSILPLCNGRDQAGALQGQWQHEPKRAVSGRAGMVAGILFTDNQSATERLPGIHIYYGASYH